MDVLNEILQLARTPAAFLALFAVLFVVGKFLNNLVTDFEVDEELVKEDNPALAVSTAGYYVGIIIIFIGAVIGPSSTLLQDLLLVGAYGLGGILLLLVARVVNDRLILRGFSARPGRSDAGVATVVREPGRGLYVRAEVYPG